MNVPNAISSRDAHIWSLRISLLLMGVVLLCCLYALLSSEKQIVVHLPPFMQDSAVLRAEEIVPASVYAFALSIFKRINFWQNDGGADYPLQIQAQQCFLTPNFKRWLHSDMQEKRRRGELRRGRGMFSLSGYAEERVRRIAPDTWVVLLDLGLREWLQDRIVKNTTLRYTLRVVRSDFSSECNPWGLALDAHENLPERI